MNEVVNNENAAVKAPGVPIVRFLARELSGKKVLVAIGFLLALLPVTARLVLPGVEPVVMAWVIYGLLCFYPLMLGASAFAGEVENGTLPFLLSMPWKRSSLWRAKVLFNLSVIALQVGFFLAVNPLTLHLHRSVYFDFSRDTSPWALVPVLFPFLVMSVTLLSSTLLDREIVASSGALVLTVMLLSIPAMVFRILPWDPGPLTLVIFMVISCGFSLAASARVFEKGQMLDHAGEKFRQSLPVLPVFVMSGLMAMGGIYFMSVRLPVNSGTIVKIEGVTPDAVIGRTRYFSAFDQPAADDRLTLVNLKTGKRKQAGIRYVWSVSLSPDKKYALVLRGAPMENPSVMGPVGKLLRIESTRLYYILNLETLKKTPLWHEDDLDDLLKPCWISDDRVVLAARRYLPDSDRMVLVLSVYNTRGEMVKSFPLVPKPGVSIREMTLQDVEGQLYLYRVCWRGDSGKDRDLAVYRVDLDSKSLVPVLERKPLGDTDRFMLNLNPISPDGSKILFVYAGQLLCQELNGSSTRPRVLFGGAAISAWINPRLVKVMNWEGDDHYTVLVVDSLDGRVLWSTKDRRVYDASCADGVRAVISSRGGCDSPLQERCTQKLVMVDPDDGPAPAREILSVTGNKALNNGGIYSAGDGRFVVRFEGGYELVNLDGERKPLIKNP